MGGAASPCDSANQLGSALLELVGAAEADLAARAACDPFMRLPAVRRALALVRQAPCQRTPAAARAVAAVRHACWEALHTGPWHCVADAWREVHALARLLSAVLAVLPGPTAQAASPPSQLASVSDSRAHAAPDAASLCASDSAAGSCGDGGASAECAALAHSPRTCRAPPPKRQRVCTDGAGHAPQAALPDPPSGEAARMAALRHVDVALLMGAPALAPRLHAAAAHLSPPRPPDLDCAAAPAVPPPVLAGAGDLSALSPAAAHAGLTDLRPTPAPSLMQFERDHMQPGAPALLQGALDAWPALSRRAPAAAACAPLLSCFCRAPPVGRWQQVGYLEAVMGERTVPVEKGEHYLHPEWRTALVPFATFWRAAQASNTAAAVPATACTGGARVAQSGRSCGDAPVSETAGAPQAGGAAVAADVRAQSAGPTYLAQHQLFEQVPALRRDIMTPEYCALGEGEVRAVNAWLGPARTVTPLHTDPHHNLLCQVLGAKLVLLFAPDQAARLYPFEAGLTTNSSQVDARAPDAVRFPTYAAAKGLRCRLDAGQALYIPPGWWHHVESLSPSASVSFWWR